MEQSTNITDTTCRNAVSIQWCWAWAHQPHWPCQSRLSPGLPDPCCSLLQPLNKHHNWMFLWPQNQPCCPSLYSYSHDKGYPSAYTHLYIKCSTCATPTVRPCPYSTKMPDHRDVTEEVTAPGSMNDVLDPEYAWTILAICALSCWTLSLDKHYEVAHPESGPQLSHLTFIPNLIITCWKGGCYTTC